jgi:hypothetical protein
MVEVTYSQDGENGPLVVDLRDPYWAAFLAWVWPGAGHFYQRRFAKGFLFMICVVATFFYGLGLGRGRVVYASFKPGDIRWHYICQLGAGAVALPAVVQSIKTQDGGDPLFVLLERYPKDHPKRFRPIEPSDSYTGRTLKDGFMAPPAGEIDVDHMDVLGMWHYEMKHRFEMGTLFCIVAGLLNILAIYDALAGPAIMTAEQKEKLSRKKKKNLPEN